MQHSSEEVSAKAIPEHQQQQQQQLSEGGVGAFPERQLIEEGAAKIYTKFYTKNAQNQTVEHQVFYNPPQVFNRDLTLLVIRAHAEVLRAERGPEKFKGLVILDGLSASGLRAIRFLKELAPADVRAVYANDLSKSAHLQMKANFEMNGLDHSKLRLTVKDVNELMYAQRFAAYAERREQSEGAENLQDLPTTGEAFDVIDLDPFGSAVPFLDAAINSNNDTLLCITFTDSRVLCGQDVTKCFYSYGASRSRQVQAYQENAIRIAMQTINTTANRYGKYVEPYLCYQSEFYLRCFVRVRDGKERCWRSYAYTGNVYHCDNCTNYHIHPLGRSKPESKTNRPLYRINPLQQLQSAHCEQCGSLFNVNGPVWLGPLINRDFVNRLIAHLETPDFELHLKTRDRILGMLKGMSEEAALFHRPPEASDLDAEGLAEPSLYGFSTAHIGGLLRYSAISKKELFSALHSLGYKLFQSFQNPQIFKTDAPLSVIFDLHRLHKAWKLGADNYLKKVKEGSVAHLLLTKASTLQAEQVRFDLKLEKQGIGRQYLTNAMQDNWGPGKLPKKKIIEDHQKPVQEAIQQEEGHVEEVDRVEEEEEVLEKLEKKQKISE